LEKVWDFSSFAGSCAVWRAGDRVLLIILLRVKWMIQWDICGDSARCTGPERLCGVVLIRCPDPIIRRGGGSCASRVSAERGRKRCPFPPPTNVNLTSWRFWISCFVV